MSTPTLDELRRTVPLPEEVTQSLWDALTITTHLNLLLDISEQLHAGTTRTVARPPAPEPPEEVVDG